MLVMLSEQLKKKCFSAVSQFTFKTLLILKNIISIKISYFSLCDMKNINESHHS